MVWPPKNGVRVPPYNRAEPNHSGFTPTGSRFPQRDSQLDNEELNHREEFQKENLFGFTIQKLNDVGKQFVGVFGTPFENFTMVEDSRIRLPTSGPRAMFFKIPDPGPIDDARRAAANSMINNIWDTMIQELNFQIGFSSNRADPLYTEEETALGITYMETRDIRSNTYSLCVFLNTGVLVSLLRPDLNSMETMIVQFVAANTVFHEVVETCCCVGWKEEYLHMIDSVDWMCMG